ncbi:MAG TPA: c(7)-type cytochrome triheme domain-containing protein [Steroidobacteraceae bacterium]
MRRAGSVFAFVMLTVGLVGVARAVPPVLSLEFDGKGEGKVIFSGAKHSPGAPHCADCHMALFDVSRSAQITRADHRRRVYCFACHDGRTAFAARGKCDRCHEEPQPTTSALPAN